MPGTVSLTGKDAIEIDTGTANGARVLRDFAPGNAVKITFPEDLAMVKTSKNGNTVYALNENGRKAQCEIRLLAGSADDKYLNSRIVEMRNDFSKFNLLTGVFAKRVGDGAGIVTEIPYYCTGGIFKKNVEASSNSEGDVEQSVAVYTIEFGNSDRSIQ